MPTSTEQITPTSSSFSTTSACCSASESREVLAEVVLAEVFLGSARLRFGRAAFDAEGGERRGFPAAARRSGGLERLPSEGALFPLGREELRAEVALPLFALGEFGA